MFLNNVRVSDYACVSECLRKVIAPATPAHGSCPGYSWWGCSTTCLVIAGCAVTRHKQVDLQSVWMDVWRVVVDFGTVPQPDCGWEVTAPTLAYARRKDAGQEGR